MTAIPRAFCGSVMAMGRPARPAAEIAGVREAAAMVARETGMTSRPAIAREIAARVVAAMLADIERDPDDALAAALAAVEQQILPSPIVTLATCPEINTACEYVERQVARLRQRTGRAISEMQHQSLLLAIRREMVDALSRRYLRNVRG